MSEDDVVEYPPWVLAAISELEAMGFAVVVREEIHPEIGRTFVVSPATWAPDPSRLLPKK